MLNRNTFHSFVQQLKVSVPLWYTDFACLAYIYLTKKDYGYLINNVSSVDSFPYYVSLF